VSFLSASNRCRLLCGTRQWSAATQRAGGDRGARRRVPSSEFVRAAARSVASHVHRLLSLPTVNVSLGHRVVNGWAYQPRPHDRRSDREYIEQSARFAAEVVMKRITQMEVEAEGLTCPRCNLPITGARCGNYGTVWD
jgi:hypothetical protein